MHWLLQPKHPLPCVRVQVADAASWAVIDSIPYEPYTTRTSGGYTTRWLTPNATVPFSLSMETQPELPQAT